METQPRNASTLRALVMLGIFVILPVLAATWPTFSRLARTLSAEQEASALSDRLAEESAQGNGATDWASVSADSQWEENQAAATVPESPFAGFSGEYSEAQSVVASTPAEQSEFARPGPGLPTSTLATPYAASREAESGPADDQFALDMAPRAAPTGDARRSSAATSNQVGEPPFRRPAAPQEMTARTAAQADSDAFAEQVASIEQRLQALGAAQYQLEPWGNSGRLYRFWCEVDLDGSQRRLQHWEAIDVDPVAAMRDVLGQIETWTAQRQQSGTLRR